MVAEAQEFGRSQPCAVRTQVIETGTLFLAAAVPSMWQDVTPIQTSSNVMPKIERMKNEKGVGFRLREARPTHGAGFARRGDDENCDRGSRPSDRYATWVPLVGERALDSQNALISDGLRSVLV
jgi:hypothetical protein